MRALGLRVRGGADAERCGHGDGGALSGRPYSKDQQLSRGEKRYHRKVAGPKRWQQIVDSKQGPCRVCGAPPPNDPAHIIGRGQGGPDSEWNVLPLCREHHSQFDAREPKVCRAVCETLNDREYAGLIAFAGENVFERRFGIRYERAA